MATETPGRNMELLRLSTCGSVDDGKSTLIGRLLFDSKSLFDDQLEALERASRMRGDEHVNLANLTDGLRAEREQGITIDVAYRYLATPRRKFIIADTPGHVQYTRNMVTGASTANLALVLVDARKGIIEQTRRHSYIASLLGIPHLVLCVNKMDLLDHSEAIFEGIRRDFDAFATRLAIRDITCIPISALNGDNVVDLSPRMPWFKGPPLLEFLETVHIANDRNLDRPRFPVQWVNRPQNVEYHDFRGFAGQVSSGVFRVGQEIVALPSGMRSRIREIHTYDGPLDLAYSPMSVTMLLEHEIDISRGDMIVPITDIPHVSKDVEAMVCWMHEKPMLLGRKYALKHTTNTTKAIVQGLQYRVDINTLEEDPAAAELRLNEIGKVTLKLAKPVIYDNYRNNRSLGAFILVDEATHATVGAGMLLEPVNPPPLPEFDGYVI